eukprot:7089985-Prymnesium_polylepis.1
MDGGGVKGWCERDRPKHVGRGVLLNSGAPHWAERACGSGPRPLFLQRIARMPACPAFRARLSTCAARPHTAVHVRTPHSHSIHTRTRAMFACLVLVAR